MTGYRSGRNVDDEWTKLRYYRCVGCAVVLLLVVLALVALRAIEPWLIVLVVVVELQLVLSCFGCCSGSGGTPFWLLLPLSKGWL